MKIFLLLILLTCSFFTTLVWQKQESPFHQEVHQKLTEQTGLHYDRQTHFLLQSEASQVLANDRSSGTHIQGNSFIKDLPTASSIVNPMNKKHAYVTIMHGIDDTGGYKGYFYNILTMKSRLSRLGSKADFIAMVGFTKPGIVSSEISRDLAVLSKHGIKLYYLPRFRDVHIFPKVNFMEMALLKITPWNFTEYKTIQFMDADVLPHRNMDCLFQLNRNSFNTGSASPLNSGWYLALPNSLDYEKLAELAKLRMSNKWDEAMGWGTPIPPRSLYFRGATKYVNSWNFNGASLDQGLLTHYFVLHHGRVQLFDSDKGYEFNQNFARSPLDLKDVLKKCDVRSPMDMFYHFTGRNKPWLRIHNTQKDRALLYWMKSFDELGLNVTASSLEGENLKPPLGYFHPNK
jgi:hypothetical protein